jgi:hypothetical protein
MSATLTCGGRVAEGRSAGWTGSAWIVHDDQGAYFEIKLD